MRVLISGAGVAGPTLAFWLSRYGFRVTLVEKAPALRTGGYIIDFWGAGFDIAERMGILPDIRREGYSVEKIKVVDRTGKKVAGFPAESFARVTGGRYTSLPRGELSAAIFRAIEGSTETIFGDSVVSIEQTHQAVHVTFEHEPERDFELVIGADGLHSHIRLLVFGPHTCFEKYLGLRVAAFETAGYRPRDKLTYVMYTQVGQQIARFSMRDDRTMFLFTYADAALDSPGDDDIASRKAELHERFDNSGWECPQILDALDAANELYFDRVSQIRMDPQQGLWTRGRVSLVGDAAFCVSLLAGQGSGLAMTAAYILAGELYQAKGDYATAFARYQDLFGPFVLGKQNSALRLAGSFAPKSRFALYLRNQILNSMKIPWVAQIAVGNDLTDRIVLPNYE